MIINIRAVCRLAVVNVSCQAEQRSTRFYVLCVYAQAALRCGLMWLQVTGDGVVALARAVPGLRRLALLNCELSDDHMIALASLLTSLHTLQVHARMLAFMCLPEAPCGCHYLQKVHVARQIVA